MEQPLYSNAFPMYSMHMTVISVFPASCVNLARKSSRNLNYVKHTITPTRIFVVTFNFMTGQKPCTYSPEKNKLFNIRS